MDTVRIEVDGQQITVVRGAETHALEDGRIVRLSWVETCPVTLARYTVEDATEPTARERELAGVLCHAFELVRAARAAGVDPAQQVAEATRLLDENAKPAG